MNTHIKAISVSFSAMIAIALILFVSLYGFLLSTSRAQASNPNSVTVGRKGNVAQGDPNPVGTGPNTPPAIDPTIKAAYISRGTAIIVVIISAVGGIIIAIIGKVPLEKLWSWNIRSRQNIPNIVGTKWKAHWYKEDDKIPVSDQIEFVKWTKGNRYTGKGTLDDPNAGNNPKQYIYSFEGEVTADRTVLLTYYAEDYPNVALVGSACLHLDDTNHSMNGWWIGKRRVKDDSGQTRWEVLPGKVTMKKIS